MQLILYYNPKYDQIWTKAALDSYDCTELVKGLKQDGLKAVTVLHLESDQPLIPYTSDSPIGR